MRSLLRHRLLAVAAALTVAAGLTGALTAEARDDDVPMPVDGRPPDLAAVPGFPEFALYALGDRFEGLPLRAVTRRDDRPVAGERVRANYVGFVYGDCAAHDEMGCAPPLEVQIWPSCERSFADYTLTPAGEPLPSEPTFIRGVPAAVFEDGLRVELYTGAVTVVVFGLEPGQTKRAAMALRAANALASPAPMLPAPVPGAMNGALRCSG